MAKASLEPISTDSPALKKRKKLAVHPIKEKVRKILIIVGAASEFSKTDIFPALWDLFEAFLLPSYIHIIAYANSRLSKRDLKNRCKEFMPGIGTRRGRDSAELFWKYIKYVQGDYRDVHRTSDLTRAIKEADKDFHRSDRIFYLAIPPADTMTFAGLIKDNWRSPSGFTKILFQGPFEKENLSTISKLGDGLHLQPMDNYTSLEVVSSLICLRLTNRLFCDSWNRHSISAVLITHKTHTGVKGARRKKFDSLGIIRKVMLDRMFNMMLFIGMEPPQHLHLDSIKESKLKFAKSIRHVDVDDVVLGQYVAKPAVAVTIDNDCLGEKNTLAHKDCSADKNCLAKETCGYNDNVGFRKKSKTPTFATAILYADNERWQGVPFIFRCGLATNNSKDEVRIQFKQGQLLGSETISELVIQTSPVEKISLRTPLYQLGKFDNDSKNSEVDLSYGTLYDKSHPVNVYCRNFATLFEEADPLHFSQQEELSYSNAIFQPVLERLTNEKPLPYEYGSLGPVQADALCEKHGFRLSTSYPW